ncbi:TPA: hypothetical protein ACGDTB_000122 [Acinetobacter baumannii]
MSTNYWEVVTETILGDAGFVIEKDQLQELAKQFESAASMESESTGEMYISHNPEAIELAQLKAEQAKHEKWFHSTLPCKPCYQTGVTQDRYGRYTTCPHCSGKGRVNRGYWN